MSSLRSAATFIFALAAIAQPQPARAEMVNLPIPLPACTNRDVFEIRFADRSMESRPLVATAYTKFRVRPPSADFILDGTSIATYSRNTSEGAVLSDPLMNTVRLATSELRVNVPYVMVFDVRTASTGGPRILIREPVLVQCARETPGGTIIENPT